MKKKIIACVLCYILVAACLLGGFYLVIANQMVLASIVFALSMFFGNAGVYHLNRK